MASNSLVDFLHKEFVSAKDSLDHSIQNGDPRVQDWPLVYSPWPMLCLCVMYIAMCVVGPKLMARRQPIPLTPVLVIYNWGMVLLSLYMLKEFFLSSSALKYTYLCDSLRYDTDEWSMRLASAIWFFYISKFIEFVDTLFFILRKKNNQITFLHIYHHVTMFFLWWVAVKWFAGGNAFFSPMLNCFVHTIMYTYYMLSALGEKVRRYLWWKKYVTILQMMQFFIVIAHNVYALYTDCDYDRRVEWVCAIYLSSLFILFMNFFIRSYIQRPRQKQKTEEGNGVEVVSSTVSKERQYTSPGVNGGQSLTNRKKDN